MQPTHIEAAILKWFAENSPELAAQIGAATISSRERTPCGVFSRFANSPKEVDRIIVFEGCGAFDVNGDLLADCLLHTSNGEICYLEIMGVSDVHPQDLEQFHIQALSSNVIDLRHEPRT